MVMQLQAEGLAYAALSQNGPLGGAMTATKRLLKWMQEGRIFHIPEHLPHFHKEAPHIVCQCRR